MIWLLDSILLCFLVMLSVITAISRDLLAATIALSIYSLVMAIVFAQLNAPDVALTEAAVGAGITGLLFFAAITKTTRWEED